MSGFEMRQYKALPGKIGDIQGVMREVMVPLMREYGMTALGFFSTTDDAEIYWFVHHRGDKGIEADWQHFHADPRWKNAMAERTQGTPFISGEVSTPMKGIEGLPPVLEQTNMAIVGAFSEGLFRRRDTSVVDQYVRQDYVNHNPHAYPGPDGVKGFVQHFFGENPDAVAEAQRIAAQGDLVFVHSSLKTTPADRGMAVVDIFRLVDGRLVEHWDVVQPIPEQTQSGAPMI